MGSSADLDGDVRSKCELFLECSEVCNDLEVHLFSGLFNGKFLPFHFVLKKSRNIGKY